MSRLLIFLLLPALAAAQAVVEYGLGAGRAATTAAPAKSLGKSMSGIAGSLDKALNSGQPAAEAPKVNVVKTEAKAAPAPLRFREDANGIEPGIGYDELLRRFGPPAMSITIDGEKSLTYQGINATYHVTVKGGKVTTIR